MTRRDEELARILAKEHAKIRKILKPFLDAPRPVPGGPSPGWDKVLRNHEKVVEAIARLHEARGKKHRDA